MSQLAIDSLTFDQLDNMTLDQLDYLLLNPVVGSGKLRFPSLTPVPNNSDVDAITTAMIEMRL